MFMDGDGPLIPIEVVVPQPTDDDQEAHLSLIFDQLRTLFDCELIEHVNVWFAESYRDMFVDEEGKITGRALNEAATQIYRANTLKNVPGVDPESLHAIYGPAVVFLEKVWP
jgi:16S rRNA C967 or C1407 C5-methylase (RsmB/RsmF family)